MAIETLSSGASSARAEQFSFLVDYDTTAQDIGLTCSGTGHASLTVQEVSNGNVLGTINCDQYGSTTGTVTNGASDGPVTYSGQRVVVLGPGATGVQADGSALPTRKVSSAVVGQFNVPKGQTATLNIALDWFANSFSQHPQ